MGSPVSASRWSTPGSSNGRQAAGAAGAAEAIERAAQTEVLQPIPRVGS